MIRRPKCIFCMALGCLFVIYYILCGVYARFDQSMLWVWPVMGVSLAVFGVAGERLSLLKNRLPRFMRIMINCGFALAAAVFVLIEMLVVSGGFSKCPEGADYVVLLGARTGSITIESRINTAAEYLKANPDTNVICTGGQGADEEMPEGEYMKRGLMARGIAEERIITETESTSTYENMLFASRLIGTDHASIAVVSNDYHIFRAKALARKHFDCPVYGLPMKSNPFTLPHYMLREFFTVAVDFLRGNLAF